MGGGEGVSGLHDCGVLVIISTRPAESLRTCARVHVGARAREVCCVVGDETSWARSPWRAGPARPRRARSRSRQSRKAGLKWGWGGVGPRGPRWRSCAPAPACTPAATMHAGQRPVMMGTVSKRQIITTRTVQNSAADAAHRSPPPLPASAFKFPKASRRRTRRASLGSGATALRVQAGRVPRIHSARKWRSASKLPVCFGPCPYLR